MKLLLRLIALPALLVVATLLALLSALGLALADLAWLVAGRRQHRSDTVPSARAASVVT